MLLSRIQQFLLSRRAHVSLRLIQRLSEKGRALEVLQGLDDNWSPVVCSGVVVVTSPNSGQVILAKLRKAFEGECFTPYLFDLGFGTWPDKVAVVPSSDPFHYLNTVRTNSITYRISHAEVLARVRAWEARYGFTLDGAGVDWLLGTFSNPPADWQSFAAEVFEFAPDVVRQGAGSVAALADELKRLGGVYIWWQ